MEILAPWGNTTQLGETTKIKKLATTNINKQIPSLYSLSS
jgi:hypothetical protein